MTIKNESVKREGLEKTIENAQGILRQLETNHPELFKEGSNKKRDGVAKMLQKDPLFLASMIPGVEFHIQEHMETERTEADEVTPLSVEEIGKVLEELEKALEDAQPSKEKKLPRKLRNGWK